MGSRRPGPARTRAGTGHEEAGAALLLVLFFSIAIAGFVLALYEFAGSRMRLAASRLERLEALAVAEGTTEGARRAALDALAQHAPVPTSGTVWVRDVQGAYTIEALGSGVTVDETSATAGVQTTVYPYRIRGTATVGRTTVAVTRIVHLRATPAFQFAAYYDGDLELHPSASMTWRGFMRASGDVYVGSSAGGATIAVDAELFQGQRLFRCRKTDPATLPSTLRFRNRATGTLVTAPAGLTSASPTWRLDAESLWAGSVETATHGVRSSVAARRRTLDAFDGTGARGYYHARAGLVVRDKKVFDANGNDITSLLLPDTVKERSFFDGREEENIKVTDIDLTLLRLSLRWPANGLLYAYRTDASPTKPYGIRLRNGASNLQPLTVVSEDPVFVLGDFNTGSTQPVAIMADAVSVLSNAWNDSKANKTLPAASNTSCRFAVLTGDVPSNPATGEYSGGLENLVRLHESWTGRTLTLRGSFVRGFASEISRAPWASGGDNYDPPNRDYDFYQPFAGASAPLPPFTPMVHIFEDVEWTAQ